MTSKRRADCNALEHKRCISVHCVKDDASFCKGRCHFQVSVESWGRLAVGSRNQGVRLMCHGGDYANGLTHVNVRTTPASTNKYSAAPLPC